MLENILSLTELEPYNCLYDDVVSGKIDAERHRHDLGSHVTPVEGRRENICQIMWPSLYLDKPWKESILHNRVVTVARQMMGEDMDFDFDMLISKDGGSLVETPWHQDESYWLDLPDKVITARLYQCLFCLSKRALSFWFPMADATTENGCMWFISGSHKLGLREHRSVAEGECGQ